MGDRSLRALLAPALLLQLGGCCNLASLFCGPDRSKWVSESYVSPQDALATLLEAIRRDNPRVICEALSPEFRRRLGVRGCFETALAWEKIKERTSGAHLLGEATVSAPQPLGAASVRYYLSAAGYHLAADLSPLPRVGVRYRIDGLEEPQERFVPNLTKHVQLTSNSAVLLTVPVEDLPADLQAADIVSVTGTIDWKVDALFETAAPVP